MEAWSALVVAFLVCASRSAYAGYENFTVGDTEGWKANPSVSYSKWASDKNFSLGDFLLFDFAKSEYNVILTYNETLYENCDYLNSNGDFSVWGELSTTNFSAIPLVQTGPNYFFCGYQNGALCPEGMKFSVDVARGDGLPPSLATPPPALTNASPPLPPSGSGGGDVGGGSIADDASYKHYCTGFVVLTVVIPFMLFPHLLF